MAEGSSVCVQLRIGYALFQRVSAVCGFLVPPLYNNVFEMPKLASRGEQ